MRNPTLGRARGFLVALIVLPALPVLLGGVAQTPTPAQSPQQEKAAAIKQAIAANQAKLKQYSWVETTKVLLKGEVKKEDQKHCFYGADGKVQKTPIPGAAPPPPEQHRGRIGEKVVEHKVDDMKEYMQKVVALVHEYVPPSAQKIQAAESAGNLSVVPTGTTTTLTVKDYVQPGDSLSLTFDMAAKKFLSYNVKTWVEKPTDDDVTLAVTFATLADGTSYPQNIVLDAVAKHIQVNVTNSGYKKSGS